MTIFYYPSVQVTEIFKIDLSITYNINQCIFFYNKTMLKIHTAEKWNISETSLLTDDINKSIDITGNHFYPLRRNWKIQCRITSITEAVRHWKHGVYQVTLTANPLTHARSNVLYNRMKYQPWKMNDVTMINVWCHNVKCMMSQCRMYDVTI